MKIVTALLALVCAMPLAAQQPTTTPAEHSAAQAPKQPPLDIPKNMRPYFVVFLVRPEGSKDEHPSPEMARKHLAFIRSQVEAKKYVLVGPMTDHGRIVGMAIVDAKTTEEARAIAEQDPMVQAHEFNLEVHPAMYAEIISNAKY